MSIDKLAEIGVIDVAFPKNTSTLMVLKMSPGSNAKSALRKVMKSRGLTLCVDEDIDITDFKQIIWGISTRFQPSEDVILSKGGIGIDGTKPIEWKAKKATLPST